MFWNPIQPVAQGLMTRFVASQINSWWEDPVCPLLLRDQSQGLGYLVSPEAVVGLTPAHLTPPDLPKLRATAAQRQSPPLPARHTKPARRRGAELWGGDRFGSTGSRPAMSGNKSCQETAPPTPLLRQRLPEAPAQPWRPSWIFKSPRPSQLWLAAAVQMKPRLPWTGAAVSRVWGRERRPAAPECACATPAHARASSCCRNTPSPLLFLSNQSPSLPIGPMEGQYVNKGAGRKGILLPNQKAGRGRGLLSSAIRPLRASLWPFTSAAAMGAALPAKPRGGTRPPGPALPGCPSRPGGLAPAPRGASCPCCGLRGAGGPAEVGGTGDGGVCKGGPGGPCPPWGVSRVLCEKGRGGNLGKKRLRRCSVAVGVSVGL